MTPEQTSVISQTIPVLQQYGEKITKVFYSNMLAAHPELNSVFNVTNQKSGYQARVLAEALYAYALNINNLEALTPMLELVCHRHASLEITPGQYDIVGKYLIEAMQEVLGDAFTPGIRDAWTAAYGALAGIMIQKERSLYDQDGEWKDWRDFRIVKIARESDEISSFYLSPVDGKPLPAFIPGQYVSVRVYIPEIGYMQARQYSMSDIPSSEYYRISVKQEQGQRFAPGVLSNVLHGLKEPGQVVNVSHPRGNFHLDSVSGSSPIVLIAGGVGITPLVSMSKFLSSSSSATKRPVHLIYAARTTTARAFYEEIMEISRANTNFNATFFIEAPEASDKAGTDYHHIGRLNLQRLHTHRDLFLNEAHTKYYICGPSPFLDAVRRSLTSEGVDSSRIKAELFGVGGFVESKPQTHL
ncbi:uncharacterized protein APUU_30169A [Aspergillus puulaauensis]|uniref:nitric oxide dioxygenase n=1 Tax=Aspergillus puulaauensis TaxID=1220207 RepID=A0A7R7XK02_9EURO|nr:uncharacterized protein APUU_30169A [Aspergillus puulaauensis]BCS21944.1 hypothetical protein APUU_30169A [Aspergillus puulaauensis]